MMVKLGNPIKMQAGGIADRINEMVEKLERGDTAAQRIMERLFPKKGNSNPETDESSPLGRLATKLLGLVDPDTAKAGVEADAAERKRALPGQAKDQKASAEDLERDYVDSRRTLERTGRSPQQIEAILRSKRLALREAKRAQRALEAEAGLPGLGPNSPAAASTAGVPSLIDQAYRNRPALPFPQQPTPAPRTVPLPPQRPIELGGKPLPVEVYRDSEGIRFWLFGRGFA